MATQSKMGQDATTKGMFTIHATALLAIQQNAVGIRTARIRASMQHATYVCLASVRLAALNAAATRHKTIFTGSVRHREAYATVVLKINHGCIIITTIALQDVVPHPVIG